MFSLPDIALVSVLALLLFGPDRLPSLMRQAGRFMREVQNTSQSFVAEMERAADVNEASPASYAYPATEAEAEPPEHPEENEPVVSAQAEAEPVAVVPVTGEVARDADGRSIPRPAAPEEAEGGR